MGQTTSTPIPGPRGDIGPPGRDGKDGNSITGPPGAPGAPGASITGAKGDSGKDGINAAGIPEGNLMYFKDTSLGTSPVGIFLSNNNTNSTKADATNSIIINDTATAAVKALALYGNSSSGTKKVNIYDNLFVNGNVSVPGKSVLEFGNGVTKQIDAGKIGYQTFTTGSLDIVGAATGTGVNRNVKIWDDLQTNGNISIPSGSKITFRDNNHFLAWDGLLQDGKADGPNLSGFSGGKLSSSKGDNLIWDASGNVTISNGLKLGDAFLKQKDEWIRVLSDPANSDSYNKGLAAKNLWAAELISAKSIKLGGVSLSTNDSGDVLITSRDGKQWIFGSNGTLYNPGAIEVNGVDILNEINNIKRDYVKKNAAIRIKGNRDNVFLQAGNGGDARTSTNKGEWEKWYIENV